MLQERDVRLNAICSSNPQILPIRWHATFFRALPDPGTDMKKIFTPTFPRFGQRFDACIRPKTPWRLRALPGMLALLLSVGIWPVVHAADPAHVDHGAKPASAAGKKVEAASDPAAADAPELAVDIKKALRDQMIGKKKLSLVISDKPESAPAAKSKTKAAAADHANPDAHAAPAVAHSVAAIAHPAAAKHAPAVNPRTSRDYIRAKAAALTGHEATAEADGNSGHQEKHWSYAGETGPQAWSKLNPEFNVCAVGKRQSPINIEEPATLQGPAEPLQFNYTPSNGVVVNNGHTIQVNVQGNNTLTVRGSTYNLLQIHFHTPSEEKINFRNYAMVAHLVHQNTEGQLAVVAVLLDPGVANPLIDKVWTYMPLDVTDQVRMPVDLVNMNELLPKDQRYYQFIGSLTTPPCTEGVLWMVFKQPTQISKEQLRLFQQIYPYNARPVQPVNNRPVRNAQ
jgi:carbonic anhydrase